jgi:hypothetical protein
MSTTSKIILAGFGLFILALLVSTPHDDNARESSLSKEDTVEYQSAVYEHMKVVTEDPDIDSIRVDGSLLYINFIRPQPTNEYRLVAEMNAVKFSNFKKSQTGVSGVTVICTYNGKVFAEASARKGRITESKIY